MSPTEKCAKSLAGANLEKKAAMKNCDNRLVDADYVMESLGVSRATAYRVIRSLNEELESAGVRCIRGKISERYFLSRYFSMPSEKVKGDGRS